MGIPLLVVTSDGIFGNLIRRNLEEGGRFSVYVVDGGKKAEQQARDRQISLAFLDTDLIEDADVLQTGRSLQQINRSFRFIIASGGGWHAGLEELHPLGYLSKPYYLPDLMNMMKKVFPTGKDIHQPAGAGEYRVDSMTRSEPPWLTDINRAAQHLTRLSLESSAQAALITRQDTLWAYAGQLPQDAAHELAETVTRYRDKRGESDLLRFIRLESTKADHMLYATRLNGVMVLALVFDAETPFSTIRKQAGSLVRSLSTAPPLEHPAPEAPEIEKDQSPGPNISFADILNDVPPPNPVREIEERPIALYPPFQVAQEEPLFQDMPAETAPTVIKPLVYTDEEESSIPALPEVSRFDAPETMDKRTAAFQPAAENRLNASPETRGRFILEPVSASVYNLTYACILVPRFPEHLLVGEMAEKVREWVFKICIAFGWRLEHISVHPDYLQWMANVPPATSPAYVMRTMRQHTSARIFELFPRFKLENPSGDYWAPGNMIVGGTQSPPAQLVRDFIQQTRERQGIPRRKDI